MSYDNWEFVSSSVHEPNTSLFSSSNDGVDHEASSCAANQLIDVNYFSSPREDFICHPILDDPEGISEKDESGISLHFDCDWKEPSMLIQSCIFVSSEDDDISSQSCSDDSGEGTEHTTRETAAAELLGGESAAAFSLDVSPRMESIETSSHIERLYVVPVGDTKRLSWRTQMRAWLYEARTATTFCSIALAATVLGLAMIGNGWRHMQMHYYKSCCQFYMRGKGMTQMIYQLLQVKESSSNKRILTSKYKGTH